MKKLIVLPVILLITWRTATAQNTIRPTELGVSFILDDYKTARLIRTTSLASVRGKNQWTSLGQQSPGAALHYFKGITTHFDFEGTLAGSYVSYPVGSSGNSNDGFLMEAEATGNLKLLPEQYCVNPYAIGGVGISDYKNYWGAYVPLGLGLKVNLFHEADVFITMQYHVPVGNNGDYHFVTSLGIAGLLGGGKSGQ